MLQSTHGINSVFEFGCNEGLNLRALRYLNPDLCISAIDINKNAVNMAKTHGFDNVHQGSIIEPMDVKSVDLTFTTGVLIHINPEYLVNVYDNLVQSSDRYIIVSEYYSPNPVSVTYRGHENRLFKRDFAGELIDKYNLKLIDYGFTYHRDKLAPLDDPTWFLLEK